MLDINGKFNSEYAITVKSNGEGIRIAKQYEIDFSKVNTLEHVIEILKALDIRVVENYGKIEGLKPFLKEIKRT